MLTKYKLTNIPEGGVFHILPGRRRVRIVKEMTNEQADELISLGVAQYFLPINDHLNGEEQNSSSENTGSAGNDRGSGATANHSGSGSVEASGSGAGDQSAAGRESYQQIAGIWQRNDNQPGAGSQSGASTEHITAEPDVRNASGHGAGDQPGNTRPGRTRSGNIRPESAKRKSTLAKKD